MKRVLLQLAGFVWRLVWRVALVFALVSILLVVLFRYVPPPGSMVMLERKVHGWLADEPLVINHHWQDWEDLADTAKLAVIAAEDQRFPFHSGFDLIEIRQALSTAFNGGRLRGASTISQQTAKNVFLWSDRSWGRKLLESWFTFLIELIWDKQRILEVYLNVAEWDAGVFGLEAASQHYFGLSASRLNDRQASLLAAILPSPLTRSAAVPGPQVEQRSQWIRLQMRNLGGVRYLQHLVPPNR